MQIKMGQTTTKLGTKLVFKVMDLRGKYGFPQGQQGFVFEYIENRTIQCKYTGVDIKRNARYIIRTTNDNKGWRIDLMRPLGPAEAVYGPSGDRIKTWGTATAAAKALVAVLDEIAIHSSLSRV